jgi:DNA-binding transcriptional LysR family regulator
MERAVAAAPDFWRRHGKPKHPSALDGSLCLPYLLGSDATRWQFEGPDGTHVVEARGSFRADNSLLLVDAMRRGVGVGLVPRVMMRAEVEAGTLEAALDDWRTESRRLYAVYPSREHLPRRVREFVRYLQQALASAI